MSYGGSVSAMVSSLKSNNRLRRNKKSYVKFYKKPIVDDSIYLPLSKEENLRIIEENRKVLKQETMVKEGLGVFFILLYGSIIIYTMLIFLK